MATKKKLKPIIKWSGGKADEIKEIEKYLPKTSEYKVYIEPFVGGGSTLFHIQPEKSIINDVHKELINFYNQIKNGNLNKIIEFMDENPNEEENYYKIRDEMETKDKTIEDAQRFYYIRKTCYRGMMRYNLKGKFNIPFGRYKTCNYDDLKNEKYFNILSNSTILCEDFTKIFEKYNSIDNFMFLDPPYDSTFTNYGYCKFEKEDHVRLAKCFKETQNKCLMIIGKTDFIVELYKDYIVAEYEKKYRFKIHSGRVGESINNIHLVIKNY